MKGQIGDKQRLEHMLLAIAEVEGFVAGLTRPEFDQDHKTLFASVRGLEILGEAARHVSDETKTRFPEVPWQKATHLRNFVIHQYFAVDNEILWEVIQHQLPPLRPQLEQVLRALST
ncbi:DUF86 domain-containing protein [Hymenobacter sp. APR13]|uniref:HepT-like ribonuclease domain-containing protein n=1 Tax=Hymenobacter sp. APR13 TaxID=1356852 RepID=UPI0009006106|nr:DUF86 domain-containing protein [Hymenobacter sp. APR13]